MSTFVKADVFISEIPDDRLYDRYYGDKQCHCGKKKVVAAIDTFIPGLRIPQQFVCHEHLNMLRSHIE